MPRSYEFGAPSDDGDIEAFTRAICLSFNSPQEDVPGWLAKAGHDNIRIVRRGSTVVGGLLLVPQGQFFGSRSIPMTGIAGVAISPEYRGQGAGGFMMQATVRELREIGTPLSVLYASTFPLYRSAGYEQAGILCEARVALRHLESRDRTLTVRQAEDSDHDAIRAVYDVRARHCNGFVDRGPYVWGRVRELRREVADGFVIEKDGAIDGYVFYIRRAVPGDWTDVSLTDWGAASPESFERLLSLCADQFAMGATLTWRVTPSDPIVTSLRDRGFEIEVKEYWFLRIVDVERALALRGYAPWARGELHLQVRDPSQPENDGRWLLTVEDGIGGVERGGDGSLEIDARGLAPLFSGHARAEELVLRGSARATPAVLAQASSLFAGGTPAMVDFF